MGGPLDSPTIDSAQLQDHAPDQGVKAESRAESKHVIAPRGRVVKHNRAYAGGAFGEPCNNIDTHARGSMHNQEIAGGCRHIIRDLTTC
eukprot:4399322-Prymnesium_polylepis.1